jgi:hypothetical protein
MIMSGEKRSYTSVADSKLILLRTVLCLFLLFDAAITIWLVRDLFSAYKNILKVQSKSPYKSEMQFQKTCGDSNPPGLQDFYPVFVNKVDQSTFNYIRRSYCGDAFIVTRKSKTMKSIQVASFLSMKKATEFAKAMDRDSKINHVEVGTSGKN